MFGGEENLWFIGVLKHFISELILPETAWKGIKTFSPIIDHVSFRTSEFGCRDYDTQ